MRLPVTLRAGAILARWFHGGVQRVGEGTRLRMKPAAYITTSWDDGHPLDLRVADLLAKYGLSGTFYVPMTSEYGTMSQDELRELSSAFEIGAHTLHHVELTGATEQLAREEIADSKSWLEDRIGLPCRMFCPPKGRYSNRHLHLIRDVG